MKGFFTPSRWLFLIGFYMLIFQGLNSQSARPAFVDELPPLCSGDLFTYRIFEPGVSYWEWSFSPEWAVPLIEDSGPNGFQIISHLFNPTLSPVFITGTFIGYRAGTQEIVTKKINFWVRPKLSCLFDKDIPFDQSNESISKAKLQVPTHPIESFSIRERSISTASDLRVYPNPASEQLTIEWPVTDMPIKLIISCSDGRTIRSSALTEDHGSYIVDLGGLRAGIYFITLIFSDTVFSTSFVKE